MCSSHHTCDHLLVPKHTLGVSFAVRHIYALITGFLLVYYPFGFGSIHAVVPSTLVYLAMLIMPSSSGLLAWMICFPYLIYL